MMDEPLIRFEENALLRVLSYRDNVLFNIEEAGADD